MYSVHKKQFSPVLKDPFQINPSRYRKPVSAKASIWPSHSGLHIPTLRYRRILERARCQLSRRLSQNQPRRVMSIFHHFIYNNYFLIWSNHPLSPVAYIMSISKWPTVPHVRYEVSVSLRDPRLDNLTIAP